MTHRQRYFVALRTTLWTTACGCIQLRTAEHRAKFARVQQLRPRCTARPSAFPKLNVAGSNPVARSNSRRLARLCALVTMRA